MKDRFPWGLAFRLAIGSFGIALIGPSFSSYIPIFLSSFGLDPSVVGSLGSLDAYGGLLVVPAVAALSDRLWTPLGRRRPFMLAGALLAAISFFSLPFMTSLPTLLTAMIGTVVGMALLRGPNASLLGDLFTSAARSRASGVVNLLAGISWVLAFGLGGALFRIDQRLPFFVMGSTMLLCVLFVVATTREPKIVPRDDSSGSLAPTDPRVLSALRRLVVSRDRSLLLILLALLLLTSGLLAVAYFFTLYARNVLGLDPGTGTQLLGLFAASGVLASIPVGLLSNRLGRRRTIAGGFAMLALLFVAAYFTTNVTVIAILLILAGIAATPGSVDLIPMVLDAAPTRDVGTYIGMTYLFGALGGVLGPLLAGVLISLTGDYRSLFLFGPLVMALGLVLILAVRSGEARE